MKKTKKRKIFLDYASSTPVCKSASLEVSRVLNNFWHNPSSLYTEGEESKKILEEARKNIAKILHCKSGEIIFTSTGTESLNTAIFGVVNFLNKDFKPHIIVSTIEHSSILEPIKKMIEEGSIEVSFLNPNQEGQLSLESIKNELRAETVLVIVGHANGEIGSIQPVSKISSVIKKWKFENKSHYPYFLVDASQSFLYQRVDFESLGCDILVIDSIKIYGPRGVALLAFKNNVNLKPIIYGGGQEAGIRSGTENVAAVSGFSKAIEFVVSLRKKENERLTKLRDYFINNVSKEIKGSSLNGSLKDRLANNINVCFEGRDSEFLVIKLDTLGFAVSPASACRSISLDNSSYVITSLGKEECASSSIRITLGLYTKKSDLDTLLNVLKKIIV